MQCGRRLAAGVAFHASGVQNQHRRRTQKPEGFTVLRSTCVEKRMCGPIFVVAGILKNWSVTVSTGGCGGVQLI